MTTETEEARPGPDLVKVHVTLGGSEKVAGESLWAEAVGGGSYRILNVPFLSPDLHYGDVVRCRRRQGILEVLDVVEEAPEDRYVFAVRAGVGPDRWRALLDTLSGLGARVESSGDGLIAAQVPRLRSELLEAYAETSGIVDVVHVA